MNTEDRVQNLKFMVRTYLGLKKEIVSARNRLLALNPEAKPEHQDIIKKMESFKSAFNRRIKKELKYWPIWTEWMEHVPGIGGYIGGSLTLLYYYKFIPLCRECNGDVFRGVCTACGKGVKENNKNEKDKILKHRIAYRDFPNVSKWWAFMGRHTVNGKVPKRKAGQQSTWSAHGKNVGYDIADQFNRKKTSHYGIYLLERKEKRVKTHPDTTKLHRLNMAKNEAVKLFLSHFWHVARTLDGKSTEGPYVEIMGGHTGIIPPYYWDDDIASGGVAEGLSYAASA